MLRSPVMVFAIPFSPGAAAAVPLRFGVELLVAAFLARRAEHVFRTRTPIVEKKAVAP